jgi:hypothetical protein
MKDFVYIIVIVHEMVESVQRFDRADVKKAEEAFVSAIAHYRRDGDALTQHYLEGCLEDGYESFGQGCSIQLHWSNT